MKDMLAICLQGIEVAANEGHVVASMRACPKLYHAAMECLMKLENVTFKDNSGVKEVMICGVPLLRDTRVDGVEWLFEK